jgi:transcriptional regulator with XRE-family HTH domain
MDDQKVYPYAEIGKRLKSIREGLNLTQEEMGKKVNLSRRGWQDFEMGKNMAGGAVLAALYEVGYSIDWVLSGKGLLNVAEINKRINQIAYDQDRMFFIASNVERYFDQNQRPAVHRARILASIYQYTAGLPYDSEQAESQSKLHSEIFQQLKFLDGTVFSQGGN